MKVEFQSSVAVSHISTLNCWCEKNINPLVPIMKKVVTPLNRRGSRRANPWIHNEYHRTQALVFPIRSFSSSLYTTLKTPQTNLKPPTMLLIWRWVCFYPGQQIQVRMDLITNESPPAPKSPAKIEICTRGWLFCSNLCDLCDLSNLCDLSRNV